MDNHNRLLLLGRSLVNNETLESFKWVLKEFLKAYRRQPGSDRPMCNDGTSHN